MHPHCRWQIAPKRIAGAVMFSWKIDVAAKTVDLSSVDLMTLYLATRESDATCQGVVMPTWRLEPVRKAPLR